VGYQKFVPLKSPLKFIVGVVNNAFKLAALTSKTKLAKPSFYGVANNCKQVKKSQLSC